MAPFWGRHGSVFAVTIERKLTSVPPRREVALDLWQLGFIDAKEVPRLVGPGCRGPSGEKLSVRQVELLGCIFGDFGLLMRDVENNMCCICISMFVLLLDLCRIFMLKSHLHWRFPYKTWFS